MIAFWRTDLKNVAKRQSKTYHTTIPHSRLNNFQLLQLGFHCKYDSIEVTNSKTSNFCKYEVFIFATTNFWSWVFCKYDFKKFLFMQVRFQKVFIFASTIFWSFYFCNYDFKKFLLLQVRLKNRTCNEIVVAKNGAIKYTPRFGADLGQIWSRFGADLE